MMIRPAELAAIKAGTVDLAFRRWALPRVVVGTRMRTSVGLLEVTSVEQVGVSSLRAEDARRAGAPSLTALKQALAARSEDPAWRIGLAYAGPYSCARRCGPRCPMPTSSPRSPRASTGSTRRRRTTPWTRQTLDLIDLNPTVRAPDLAAQVGRETADFKKDVRKLKELGLTESLAIGYLLSPRGEAVVDVGLPAPRVRAPREDGNPPPPGGSGAPATRALREVGVTTSRAGGL